VLQHACAAQKNAYCCGFDQVQPCAVQTALKTWSPGSQVRLSANTVSLQADGMDLIRLTSSREDPLDEPAAGRKHYEASAAHRRSSTCPCVRAQHVHLFDHTRPCAALYLCRVQLGERLGHRTRRRCI
jgi:hypothetical protein